MGFDIFFIVDGIAMFFKEIPRGILSFICTFVVVNVDILLNKCPKIGHASRPSVKIRGAVARICWRVHCVKYGHFNAGIAMFFIRMK